MLTEDAPLRNRLDLEARTFEEVVSQYGRWSPEGTRAQRKVERLRTHIEQIEERMPEEFWAEHQPLLQAAEQVERHYPDALVPLELYDPTRRCQKCGGKASADWEPDRLKRTCKRCGWAWYERPLDAEESLPPSEDDERPSPEELEGTIPGLTEGGGEIDPANPPFGRGLGEVEE